MIWRLIFLMTSFASAVGNYGFLVGLDNRPDYMFYLSFSSFFAGFFCYGFLPTFMAKRSPYAVSLMITVLWAIGCVTFLGIFSVPGALVVSTVFLFLCAEMTLASSRSWSRIFLLRVLMCATGIISWVSPDLTAILIRAIFIGSIAAFAIFEGARKNVWESQPAPSQSTLVLLVITNLVWVYLLPLIMVNAADSDQKLALYMITTLVPLIYFKAQDVVFKVDVVGGDQDQKSSSLLFLGVFAVPLGLFYVSFPILQLTNLVSTPFNTVILYTVSSIILLILNVYLTNSLSSAKRKEKRL
jgi:hypothetical protein